MGIDDAYHVEKTLVSNANGTTELVTIEDAGPFIRKKLPIKSADRTVWAALASSTCPRLPQIVASYEMPDCFVTIYDYVPGEALDSLVERSGRLQPEDAAQISLDVCEALSALHARGILHRDVAPGNVVIAADGAHLIDFGNARLKANQSSRAHDAERPRGTWGFAAPEQFFGKEDERADIFGLGRLLGYMLTGIEPDEDRIDEFERALDDGACVPDHLRAAIRRATSFEASSRHASVEELARDIAHEQTTSPEHENGTESSPKSAGTSTLPASAPETPLRQNGRRMPAVAAILAALILGGAVASFFAGRPASTRPPQTENAPQAEHETQGGAQPTEPIPDSSSNGPKDTLGCLKVVESGWRAASHGVVNYALTVENTSNEMIVDFPQIDITGRDGTGGVVLTDSIVLGQILPGQRLTLASLAGSSEAPEEMEFEPVSPDSLQLRRDQEVASTFEVKDVREQRHGDDLTVSGNVVCTTRGTESQSLGDVWVSVVLRDAEGKIVSGYSTFADRPDQGERAPFTIDVLDCPDHASAEVAAAPH